MFVIKVLAITLISCFSILTTAKGQTNEKVINSYDEFEGVRVIKSDPLPIYMKDSRGSAFVIFNITKYESSDFTQYSLQIQVESKMYKSYRCKDVFQNQDTCYEVLPRILKETDQIIILTDHERIRIGSWYFSIKSEPDLTDQSVSITDRMKAKSEGKPESRNEYFSVNLGRDNFENIVESNRIRMRISDVEFNIGEEALGIGERVFSILSYYD